jgi:hypothetical protein
MASIVSVEQLKGLASGSTPNTISIPAGQTLHAPGHVIAVYDVLKTDTQTSTSVSWVDITGLSVTFTPKFSTNKIVIQGHVTCSNNYDANMSIKPVKVIGGTSTDIAIADTAGSRVRGHTGYGYDNNNITNYGYTQFPINAVHTLSSSSSTTIKIQIRNGDTSGVGWSVNRAYDNDPDAVWESRATSSLIVMEIAQ